MSQHQAKRGQFVWLPGLQKKKKKKHITRGHVTQSAISCHALDELRPLAISVLFATSMLVEVLPCGYIVVLLPTQNLDKALPG